MADVEKEARLGLQVLGSRTLELPVFYDLEESSQLNKGKAFCTQLVAVSYTHLHPGTNHRIPAPAPAGTWQSNW